MLVKRFAGGEAFRRSAVWLVALLLLSSVQCLESNWCEVKKLAFSICGFQILCCFSIPFPLLSKVAFVEQRMLNLFRLLRFRNPCLKELSLLSLCMPCTSRNATCCVQGTVSSVKQFEIAKLTLGRLTYSCRGFLCKLFV